jgi:hypothetical protein
MTNLEELQAIGHDPVQLAAFLARKLDEMAVLIDAAEESDQIDGGLEGADAASLQGVAINATAPEDGQMMVYDADEEEWIPTTVEAPVAPVTTEILINMMESNNGDVVQPNVPVTFVKTGDLVVAQFGGFDGTHANNWAFFYEFIPEEFRPGATITMPYPVQKNGDPVGVGLATISTSGHLDFSGPGGAQFGNGDTGTVMPFVLSWIVPIP